MQRKRESSLVRRSQKMLTALACGAVCVSAAPAYAVPDTPLESGYVTNGAVRAIATGGGFSYIGGNFTQIGPRLGAGWDLAQAGSGEPNPDDFPAVGGGAVSATVADGSGGWFIGGSFTRVAGEARNRLAHISPDGTLDGTWNPNSNGDVFALALSGADLYVGGVFSSVGGQPRQNIAKLSATGTGTADATWNPGVPMPRWITNEVHALAVSGPDLYVGGTFTEIGGQQRSHVAKLSTSGAGDADAGWHPVVDGRVEVLGLSGSDLYIGGGFFHVGQQIGGGFDVAEAGDGDPNPAEFPEVEGGEIYAVVPDGSGGWYIGGGFESVGGVARNRLAHIDADGGLDMDWDPNPDGSVFALAVSGLDLYVGGTYSWVGGQSRQNIAKLSTGGSGDADPTWDPSANSGVYALALSGSHLYAGGVFSEIGGQSRNRIAKLSTGGAGDADPTWDADAGGRVASLAVSGSDVYAGGEFETIGGESRRHLAKLAAASGTADPNWSPGPDGPVYGVAASGSHVYAVGAFIEIGGQQRRLVAKLSATGSGEVDTSFNAYHRGDGGLNAVVVSGSDLYVGGGFEQIGGQPRKNVAKLSTTSGLADPDWAPNPGGGAVVALAVSASRVYIGGAFTSAGLVSRNHVAKLSTTGSGNPDETWDPNADGEVHGLAVSGSDVYIGGAFERIGPRIGAGMDLAQAGDGEPNPAEFPEVEGGEIDAVVPDGSGGWYIGGGFRSVGGVARNQLAHINAGGGLDMDWNPNPDGYVYALALSGSELYVGGYFSSIGGQSRNNLAKLSTSGSGDADETWNPDPDDEVYALALSGSELYVGGYFSSIGGQSRNNLAKLSTSGSGDADETWNPDPDDEVYALALSGSELYVGGYFSSIGGQSRNNLAKLSTSGSGMLTRPGTRTRTTRCTRWRCLGPSFTSAGTSARSAVSRATTSRSCPRAGLGTLTRPGTRTRTQGWTRWRCPGPTSTSAGSSVRSAVSRATTSRSCPRAGLGTLTRPGTRTPTTGCTRWRPPARVSTSAANSAGPVPAAFTATASRRCRRRGRARSTRPGSPAYPATTAGWLRWRCLGPISTSAVASSRSAVSRAGTSRSCRRPGRGDADATWNPSPTGTVRALAASGSRVYAGGEFASSGAQSVTRNGIARLDAEGVLDTTWNPNVSGTVRALALSGSDLYVGGGFSSIGGQSRNHIAKVSTSGSGNADATWNPNASDQVFALALSGSDLYVGGGFGSIGGQSRNRIAKLSATGSGAADATWNPNANERVNALALSGSDLYVGGGFSSIGGQSRSRIARLSATGSGAVDATWDPNVNTIYDAYSLALSGSDLFVSGSFGGVPGMMKLSTGGAGAADATWKPRPNGWVWAMAVSGSDLYAGGSFTEIGGQPRGQIARLSTTGAGAADATWNPSAGHEVLALAASASAVYAGGSFNGGFAQFGAPADEQPPVTTDDVPAGFRNAAVSVTLSATDSGGSGLDKTYYTKGVSPADPTAASSVYNGAAKPTLANGERIKYFSTDVAGNAEAVKTSAAAKVDTGVPSTTDDVPAGYRTAAVSVTLSATDLGGSGLDKTYFTKGAAPADPTAASSVYDAGSKPTLADGERIKYFSTDLAGNAEAVKTSAAAKVDTAAPMTSDDVPAGFRNAAVSVTLSVLDSGGSGPDKTYYTKGVAPADPTTASSVYDAGSKPILADGERIKYFSTDLVGNVEAVKTSAAATVETGAPVTSDDVPAGFRNGPVAVTLSAVDSGSAGLDQTYYTKGVAPADPTTASSVYDAGSKPTLANGERIKYFSTDLAGNVEAVKTSAAARVDTAAPTTVDNVPVAETNGPVTVTLAASDASGAGVDKTYYTLGASPADPTTASAVYNPAGKPKLSAGQKIKYFSVDLVGNAEAARTSRTLGPDVDADNDGVVNGSDNCPTVVNRDQRNSYGDPRGDACEPDTFAPKLTGLALTPAKFKVAGGTVITFTLDEAVAVRYTLEQRKAGRMVGKKCKKPTPANAGTKKCDLAVRGSFRQGALAGKSALPWPGTWREKELAPAKYRLTLSVEDPHHNKSSEQVAFQVVR